MLIGSLAVEKAWAALTPIADSPNVHDEPNLIGTNPFPGNLNPSVLETLYGEANLERIDDSQDIVFSHTGAGATAKTVARFTSGTQNFGFFPRGGGGTFVPLIRFSGFGYSPVDRDPTTLLPIAGATIVPAASGATFKLGLDNLTLSTLLSSNPAENPAPTLNDHLVTFRIVGNAGRPANVIGNLILAWEERSDDRIDRDYQDNVLEISGLRIVPEPASGVLMLAAVVGSMLGFRRRQWAR